MLRKLLYLVVLTSLIPLCIKADWIKIDKSKSTKAAPQVSILSSDHNSTVIKVELAGFDMQDFKTGDVNYKVLDLLNEIRTIDAGYPELPYVAKTLIVPDQAVVSAEVIDVGEIYSFTDVQVRPARESWIEGDPETEYIMNENVYLGESTYPLEAVKLSTPSIFRDFRIARISIFPFKYFPTENKLEVASTITVRLNYEEGDAINPKTKAQTAIPRSFGRLYRSMLFNYQDVLDSKFASKEEGDELMLCIMPDEFTESFEVYAEWKRQSGTNIHVTPFSEIDATAYDPGIIKTHITDAYNNWDTPPTYVLIVGDEGVFPHKIVSYDYSFPNEDYFVEIEGDDYFPEMMIGRFTNQGDYRMQVMINKFMLYEKEPYVEDDEWFKKGICCSNNAYESQVNTKRFAAERMLEDGNFLSVDTMMSDGNWGGGCTYDLQDVIGAIEDGRSHLNYRGEGWYSGWTANCYYFQESDVSSINNGEMFTFITSIGCGVAGFQTYGSNCFGEEWIQLGSLTSPRGGIGFVGPVSNTHTTYNNKIDKGIYTGMFQEGMDTPGQALLRGKLYMFNVFGDEYWVEYHYRVFTVLGDPSIHIWKEVPLEVDVDHVSTVSVGYNLLNFTVTYTEGGDPVTNAELCVTGENVFVTGFSDENGEVSLELYPDLDETLIVTVRGGDVIPYQGEISSVQVAEHIEPVGDPIVLDWNGNENGFINPGEHADLSFTLKNYGSETAMDVGAMLISPNPELVEVITENPVSYGDLGSGDSFTGTPILVEVSVDCFVGQVIPMEMEITSNTDTWTYDYMLEVTGCMLECNQFVVYDGNSNPVNYRMDPGETVKLILSLDNFGDDVAPDIQGTLSSSDPYITIDDGDGSFGSITSGNKGINNVNYFIVSVDPACPTDYLAEYTLELLTQGGSYVYNTTVQVVIPVSLPIEHDYSGPDAYGYYAYSNDDSFYEQTPEYDWLELDDLVNPMSMSGSDYTKTVDIPFSFKYYGVDYDKVRISTDGWIAFGNGTQVAPINASLPSDDNVSSMVAVFWDDLIDEEVSAGDIYNYYDEDNNRFIIEWDKLMHNPTIGEPERESFQVILLDPEYYQTITGDGEIIMQYREIEAFDEMTVGIENHDQDIGLQYLFNNEYAATATLLRNEYAIKFTTEEPFLSITVSVEDNMANLNPSGNLIGQNVPNPFSTQTRIAYTIAQDGPADLFIYNIRGELVRILHSGNQSAGDYSVVWDGADEQGQVVAPGVYFCQLRSGNYTSSCKMFKLK